MTTENSDFGAPAPIPSVAEEFAAQTAEKRVEAAAEAADPSMSRDVIVHPLTGNVLEFDDPTDVLAKALEDHDEILAVLYEWKQLVQAELLRRMDAANVRDEQIGPFKLSTNAPRTEQVTVDGVRAALKPLVDDDILDRTVLEKVITWTTPKPVKATEKVAKTELNKLKRHGDERVRQAVAEAITEVDQTRTLKIERVQ